MIEETILQKYSEELAIKIAKNKRLCEMLQYRDGTGGYRLETKMEKRDGVMTMTVYPVWDKNKYLEYPND